jgi:uncharacterized membrane protein YhaH (DUF805 family)
MDRRGRASRDYGENGMNSYLDGMRRYIDFSGRTGRKDYWLYVLVYFIIYIVAAAIDAGVFGVHLGQSVGILTGIVGLVHLIPGIAVGVRRLHDTDRSGWWILIVFVPVIGWIWLVVLYCFAGTPGANRFGAPHVA